MKSITINLNNRSYNIDIDYNLDNFNISKIIPKNSKIILITDKNVNFYYGDLILNKIKSFGYIIHKYVVEPGETSKSIKTLYELCEYLNTKEITRNDYLIALGGGVVGDLTGLCASIYLRGINFIQIPTTLLAMVDSSVGGKTAINMECGKNLIGTFYQPKYVYCCLDFLNTLSTEIYRDGCAEIIKYAIIYDKKLFEEIKYKDFNKLEVITRCIEIKSEIVSKDEYDNGIRSILNFGHTLGHTLEILSDFNISHGLAVAKGMLMASKIAKYLNISNIVQDTENILDEYGFDKSINYSIDDIYQVMMSDKKRIGNNISFILPKEIGKYDINKIDINNIKNILYNSL